MAKLLKNRERLSPRWGDPVVPSPVLDAYENFGKDLVLKKDIDDWLSEAKAAVAADVLEGRHVDVNQRGIPVKYALPPHLMDRVKTYQDSVIADPEVMAELDAYEKLEMVARESARKLRDSFWTGGEYWDCIESHPETVVEHSFQCVYCLPRCCCKCVDTKPLIKVELPPRLPGTNADDWLEEACALLRSHMPLSLAEKEAAELLRREERKRRLESEFGPEDMDDMVWWMQVAKARNSSESQSDKDEQDSEAAGAQDVDDDDDPLTRSNVHITRD